MTATLMPVSEEDALVRYEPLIRRLAGSLCRDGQGDFDDLCQEGRAAVVRAARSATAWSQRYFYLHVSGRMRQSLRVRRGTLNPRDCVFCEAMEDASGPGSDFTAAETADLVERAIVACEPREGNRPRMRILVAMRLRGCRLYEVSGALGISTRRVRELWRRFQVAARKALAQS